MHSFFLGSCRRAHTPGHSDENGQSYFELVLAILADLDAAERCRRTLIERGGRPIAQSVRTRDQTADGIFERVAFAPGLSADPIRIAHVSK